MHDVLVFDNLIDSVTGQPITAMVPKADPVTLKTRALRSQHIKALAKAYAENIKGMCNEE